MRAMVFDRYGEPDLMSLRDAPVPAAHEVVVPRSLALTCKTTTVQTTRQSLAVSVLDLIAMRAGEPATSAIARSLELARQVEQFGYKRYWVAEHHAIQGLACSRQDPRSSLPSSSCWTGRLRRRGHSHQGANG